MRSNLYITHKEKIAIDEIMYDDFLKVQIQEILQEYKHLEALRKYDLPVHHKLLLYGKTGCGKTMTARAIASYLDKKIIIVNLATIISSKLGETAKNIADIFKKASIENAVLFFDEFDALGKLRTAEESDSGEMKRVVNVLLQQLDYLPIEVIFIAATNLRTSIDEAILRRFEAQLEFKAPSRTLLDQYYDQFLVRYPKEYRHFERKYELSFAEVKNYIQKEVKKAIIKQIEQ
ncbi:AAA family ATPase [Aquimarina rhabdastrellae]